MNYTFFIDFFTSKTTVSVLNVPDCSTRAVGNLISNWVMLFGTVTNTVKHAKTF